MYKFADLKRFITALAVCAGVMAYSAAPAQAFIELKMSDGLGGTISYDSGPSGGLALMHSEFVDGWNIVTGIGTRLPGSPPTPNLDLDVTGSSSGSGHDLDIFFTETGESSSPVSFFGNVTHNSDAAVLYTAWADASNAPFGMGTLLFGPIVSPGSATFTPFSAAGLYSVTMKLHVTQAAGAGYSDDARLRASQVPEPTSLMLLGTGLVAVGRGIRRRIRGN